MQTSNFSPISAKQQVLGLIQTNRLAQAKSLCIQLCQRTPEDAEAWFLLAGIHAGLDEFEQVVSCCRRVTNLQPGNTMAHYNLGVALQTLERNTEAAESYRLVIRLQPEFASAHSNLGLTLWREGKYEEAHSCARQAIRLDPAMAVAHNNLGLILKSIEQLDEAKGAFREALRLNPGLAEAHYNLGLCLYKEDNLDEAESCIRQAIQLKADYAEAHRDLAVLRLKRNQLDLAAESFERYARLSPKNVDAQLSAGNALARIERYRDAEKYYRNAIAIKPDHADAHLKLGIALHELGDDRDCFAAAEQCFRKTLELDPDSAAAFFYLSNCLKQFGRLDEAKTCLQHALALQPQHDDARAHLALVLEQMGDFEGAREMLQPLLDKGFSGESAAALAYAALSRHIDRREDAIASLERVLKEQSDMRLRHRMDLHFSLGKLYDEIKDYENAFRHYEKANDLSPDRFDPGSNESMFNDLISAFAEEKQAARARASNRSRLPVFIVGMPRSGTTLVEHILASHPLVHGAGELEDIHKITKSLPETLGTNLPYPKCLDALTRKNIDPIAQRHLERLGRLANGKARVTDKMPHNFLGLGLIDLLFPEARVIHCTRDPIDTCLSIYFLHFNKHHAYSHNLEHLGLYYKQYRRLMTHWKTVLRIPVLEINYEKLVADPEPTIRTLIEFVGLEWDDRCLYFHESKRAVTTPSYDQVRRPLYKKSIARWRHYERHLGPLIAALQDDDTAGTTHACGTHI